MLPKRPPGKIGRNFPLRAWETEPSRQPEISSLRRTRTCTDTYVTYMSYTSYKRACNLLIEVTRMSHIWAYSSYDMLWVMSLYVHLSMIIVSAVTSSFLGQFRGTRARRARWAPCVLLVDLCFRTQVAGAIVAEWLRSKAALGFALAHRQAQCDE